MNREAPAGEAATATNNAPDDCEIQRDRFGCVLRPFLAELDKRSDLTPEAKGEALREHARALDTSIARDEAELAKSRDDAQKKWRQTSQLTTGTVVKRVDFYSVCIRVENEGLHTLAGFSTGEEYVKHDGQEWAGNPVKDKMARAYRWVAYGIPGDVVRSGNAGIKVMALVAQTGPLCCQELCKRIKAGERPGLVTIGGRAGKRAFLLTGSPQTALDEARKAMADPPPPGQGARAVAENKELKEALEVMKAQAEATRVQAEALSRAMALLGGGLHVTAPLETKQEAEPKARPKINKEAGAVQPPRKEQRATQRDVPEDDSPGPAEPVRNTGAEPVPEPVPAPDPKDRDNPNVGDDDRSTDDRSTDDRSHDDRSHDDRSTDDRGHDDRGHDDQGHDATAATSPHVQKPADRPIAIYPHQRFLGVAFPYGRAVMSPSAVLACEVITACHAFIRQTDVVMKLRYDQYAFRILDPRIQLYIRTQFIDFRADVTRVHAALKDRGEQGLATLEEDFRAEGGDPAAAPPHDIYTNIPPHLMPYLALTDLKGAEPAIPMSFLSYDVVEPYHDKDIPEACEGRQQVFRLIGLQRCVRQALLRFEARDNDDNDDEIFLDLLYQLYMTLEDLADHTRRVISGVWNDAEKAREHEHEWIIEEQKAQQAIEQAKSRILVVGQNQLPKQLTMLGKTADGRLAAITQDIAQFIIAVGLPGFGKTQTAMLVREGAHLRLPGLTVLQEIARTVEFIVDFNKGDSRIQSFCGLDPNPYPQHWEALRRDYGISFNRDIARFPQMMAICFPDDLEPLRELYAAEREKGLIIEPLGFHPDERGHLFWRNMISVGMSNNHQARTNDRMLVDAVIGNLGLGCEQDIMEAEFKKAKVRSYLTGALKKQMDLVRKLTYRDRYLSDCLIKPMPVQFLMRSRFLGPQVILPLEVCILAALSVILRDGSNPLRWFILHEFAKQGLLEYVVPYLVESAAQVRHNVCSYFLETQQIGFLPPEIISLATGIFQYLGVSRKDYERLQELFYAFSKIPFRYIAELLGGQAFVAFVRATDPALRNQAFHLSTRATATWAGGETISIV